MKGFRYFFVITVTLAGGLLASNQPTRQNPSAEVMLGTALHQEEVEGKLEAAIETYRKFLAEHPENRPLAAKALFHMGQCYEKLGNAEARKAYERLVRDYADQSEQVRLARSRLAALRKPAGRLSGMITRKVWAGPEVDTLGSVSSDGRYLTFTDWETGDLAIRDLETGKNRHLTNKGSWDESLEFSVYSRISPDGKQVAYAWYNRDNLCELRLIALDQPKPRVLYSNKDVDYIQPEGWTSDGNHVAVIVARKGRSSQIALVSLADGSLRVLKTFDWRAPVKVSISPDGRFVAYDFPPREESADRDIFLLSTNGGSESALIEHPANDLYPVWMPDGKHILFASDRTGSMSIWCIPITDGKPRGPAELIKEDVGRRILPMGFTREGSFYYGLQTGMTDVYIASLDFTTGKLLGTPKKATERFVGTNSRPDWSPDGRYLAFVSHRGPNPSVPGSFVVCIRSVETGAERDLSPKLNDIWSQRWSPNGRSILLGAADVKNRRGLYQMDVNSGDVTSLVQDREGEYVGGNVWSPDGRAVFYLRQEPSAKKSSIVARELETGREREVFSASADSGMNGIALSPDGQLVAFWYYDKGGHLQGLEVIPSGGGVPRELVKVEEGEKYPDYTGLAWSPDGLQVFFAKGGTTHQDLKFELWRVPVKGGRAERVDLAMTGLSDVRVHPDGQRIAFAAGERGRSEVWVMENFLAQGNPK